MAQALETATAGSAEIFFELERIELTDAGRLECRGRWFGVRGRRFVRPTLTLEADGVPRRLLADIEHKPWAPVDGDSWIAAFPWDLDSAELGELELGVAPDIAVQLPPPGAQPERIAARPHRQVVVPEEPNAAERELARVLGEVEELRGELEQSRRTEVEKGAALARRDAALDKVKELSAQLEGAVAERDSVAAELARLSRARDQAITACERLIAEKAELQVALDESRALVARAQDERAAALRDRELAQVGSAARSSLGAAQPVRRRHLRWQPRAAGQPYGGARWPVRILTLTVLIVAVLAFALIAHIV